MFKTKEIKTQTLGDKLKNAREFRKMTLKEISARISIPINYLEYLEQGDYEKLPADVYVAAYLKKYAKILNLDAEKIIEQFKTERRLANNLSGHQGNSQKLKHFINKKPLMITPKRVWLVFSIIVIALIFGYFWHQLSYLIYPPYIEITQPALDITTQQGSIKVAGQTNPHVYLTINGREVYVDNKGHFRSVVSLESGLNILKIEARDRFGKTNTVIRRIMVTE